MVLCIASVNESGRENREGEMGGEGLPSPCDDPAAVDMVAVTTALVELPVSSACTLDRMGCGWGVWRRGEPRTSCPGPHHLYIRRSQGPTNQKGLDAPDQGVLTKGLAQAVGPLREINLTFSPLISTLLLTLYFLLYSFHHIVIHRACVIVTAQLPIESDSYNIPLYLETTNCSFSGLS